MIDNPRGFRPYVRNDIFFRAIPLVLAKHPNAKFLFALMAGEPHAEKWIQELKIDHAVELLPPLSHDQMADVLRRAQIVVDAIKSEDNRLTAAVDAVHPNDNTDYLNTGLEYTWTETLFLRAGWKSLFERDTEQGWTLGAGLHYRIVGTLKVKVDYAYQDFGRLNNVQYLSVSVAF